MFIVAEIFRRSAAAEENPQIFLGIHIAEGNVGLNGIAFPFFGNCPARFDFVQHHWITARFRRRDHGTESAFDQPVERIEGVHCFRGVARDYQNFMFYHVSAV